MNTKTELEKKKLEIAHLDEATQEIIHRQHRSDQRMLMFSMISLTLLLALGTFGIYKQNQLANQNRNHIDCIVKLFTTPSLPGNSHKYIVNPDTVCNIKVTR